MEGVRGNRAACMAITKVDDTDGGSSLYVVCPLCTTPQGAGANLYHPALLKTVRPLYANYRELEGPGA